MKNLSPKQVKKILLLVLFLVVIIGVLIYGNYRKKNTHSRANNDQLFVRFESSDIVGIKNKLPVSDSLGKKFNGVGTEEGVQGYLEFSISNKGKDKLYYEVIATKQAIEGKEISDKYVKLYLTNSDNDPLTGYELNSIPVFYSFPYLKDRPSSKLLYTGILMGNSKETLKLHMWLSDNYRVSMIPEDFKIDIDVRVK